MVNGNLRGAKEQRSFKPQVGGSIPPRRTFREYLPGTLSYAESAALIERIEAGFEANGYGLWAVELPGEASCIGFVGLAPVDLDVFFAPAVEIGWRLARPFWGRGLATEGARAALTFGLRECGLPEVVSFAAEGNRRSRALMERLGMRRNSGEDFDHPLLAESDPLRRHVLYRLDLEDWEEKQSRRSTPGCLDRGRPDCHDQLGLSDGLTVGEG